MWHEALMKVLFIFLRVSSLSKARLTGEIIEQSCVMKFQRPRELESPEETMNRGGLENVH